MRIRRLLFYFITIIIICLLTYFLIGRAGTQIEHIATNIYRKVSGKLPQHFQYDNNGVPMVVFESEMGKQYSTVTVGEEALKSAVGKDTESVRTFFSCINWLSHNYFYLNDSSIIYLDNYDWPSYQMTSPWRSAMNQGRAMQAFLTAFRKTGDSLYLGYARKSMNTLYTEVSDGGVTYKDSTGYWYEEYADDNAPQSRVLNGMIVVLQGLNDYYKVTKDPGALFLFNQGVGSVKSSLHLYDNNGHSDYDILGKPAKPWYHNFHIQLLGYLYNETHDHIFNDYKQKWMRYKEPSYLTSLIHKPTRIGVFTVFSIFIAVLVFVLGIIFIVTRFKK